MVIPHAPSNATLGNPAAHSAASVIAPSSDTCTFIVSSLLTYFGSVWESTQNLDIRRTSCDAVGSMPASAAPAPVDTVLKQFVMSFDATRCIGSKSFCIQFGNFPKLGVYQAAAA